MRKHKNMAFMNFFEPKMKCQQTLLFVLSFGFQSAFALTNLVCPPIDSKGVRLINLKAQHMIEECNQSTLSTKQIYFDEKTKQYSPERAQLHETIIANTLKDKPCVSQKKPIAIFTAGFPGSGKTTFLKAYIKSLTTYLIISADSIREELPDYKGWNAGNTQAEVRDITHQLLEKINTSCPLNIIYDSTMTNNPQGYIDLIRNLKSRGYRVYIIYLKIPVKLAKQRALERYVQTGRYIPQVLFDYIEKALEPSFNQIKPEADGYVIFDSVQNKILIEKGHFLSKLRSVDN